MTSTIKVDNIQDQDGNNIINESSNTITIGASGDTVTLASGASQSGFGRSGTVDWQTTVKTTAFTAASGEGYFCNTTSAAFTVTLPSSPSALDIVAIKDYALTFDTNNLTIDPGSNKIEGDTSDMVVNTEGRSLTLVYLDSTQGWKVVNDGNSTAGVQALYVAATGGTVTTCGNFKIHTFTGPGTFCVSCGGNASGSNTVDYLVIAGGGGGGSDGGGAGAGGYRFSNGTASGCYSAGPSPLGAPALPVSAQGYPIVVGGGGSGASPPSTNGTNGVNSSFSTISSAGGGRGGDKFQPNKSGGCGGSGGGAGRDAGGGAGAGNTPPVSPPQGNDGGSQPGTSAADGAGGGGAGAVGCNGGSPGTDAGGAGGNGLASSITASAVTRAGGGGGGTDSSGTPGGGGAGGSGGGGAGGKRCVAGGAGTVNTGSGGGSGGTCANGGAGGSGIVIIRYKFQ